MQNLNSSIKKLHAEFLANKSIIPENWYPWIDILKIALRFAKVFTNDYIDKIIDELLLAIKELENEKAK